MARLGPTLALRTALTGFTAHLSKPCLPATIFSPTPHNTHIGQACQGGEKVKREGVSRGGGGGGGEVTAQQRAAQQGHKQQPKGLKVSISSPPPPPMGAPLTQHCCSVLQKVAALPERVKERHLCGRDQVITSSNSSGSSNVGSSRTSTDDCNMCVFLFRCSIIHGSAVQKERLVLLLRHHTVPTSRRVILRQTQKMSHFLPASVGPSHCGLSVVFSVIPATPTTV